MSLAFVVGGQLVKNTFFLQHNILTFWQGITSKKTFKLHTLDQSVLTHTFTGEISSDVVTPISNFAYVTLNNVKPAKKELVFIASEVPPLGIKAYYVKKNSQANEDHQDLTDILKFGNEVITYNLLLVERKTLPIR